MRPIYALSRSRSRLFVEAPEGLARAEELLEGHDAHGVELADRRGEERSLGRFERAAALVVRGAREPELFELSVDDGRVDLLGHAAEGPALHLLVEDLLARRVAPDHRLARLARDLVPRP